MIIALGFKAQNGKDTAGEAIVNYFQNRLDVANKHGQKLQFRRVVLLKFAGALYEECWQEHHMVVKDPVLLQRIGQGRRDENPDYWVNRLIEQLPEDLERSLVVITDLRYPNEARAIKSRGGYTVNVTRLDKYGEQFIAGDRPADHASEIAMDGYNWDFHLINSEGHPALLAEQAITLAEYLKEL